MTSSLDRKIERAAREAEAERLAKSPTQSVEGFNRDNHLPDGTVRPPVKALGTDSSAAGMHPKPQRMWVRDGLDWVDDNEDKCAFYFTRDGEQPTEDMANVDSIRTVKTITPMQAMAAVVNFAQNDIDIARSWHDEVVACVMEHFGDTRANADVRARAVAKVFMGRVFGISPESELFAKREELRLESEPIGPQPFPFMGSPDAADALAYSMEAWKHRAQQASGMSAQAMLHCREPSKSWLTMGLYHELQRQLYAQHQRLIDSMLINRPAPVMWVGIDPAGHEKTTHQAWLDEELPSGNFGQRAIDKAVNHLAGLTKSTPESPQATDTPRKD